jgi:hypothetical protein
MTTEGNNVHIPMTRRYPKLKQKVLIKDSKISKKLIHAWDVNHSQTEVLEIFVKNKKNLSDERYWELLRTAWVLCGSIEYNDLFRLLMKSNRKEQYYFSTPEEHNKIRELPENLIVYRATNSEKDNGLSYTLSKSYAEWYKASYSKDVVISKQVKKDQVFAYINRNNEEEIIIL